MLAKFKTKSQQDTLYHIETVSTFDFCSAEYERLYHTSQASVFQSGFFLKNFYETLVPALHAEPIIILVRQTENSALRAVLPLVRQRYYGLKILQPADLGVSDYNGIVGQESDLSAISTNRKLQITLKDELKPFDIFLFRKERPESINFDILLDGGRRVEAAGASYEVRLADDLDAWKQRAFSKSRRKGLARKRRNLEKDFGEPEFQVVTDHDTIMDALDKLRTWRLTRYPDDLFNRPEYFAFYQALALDEAAVGQAPVFVGRLDGDIVAVEFGFIQDERYHFILGAFEPERFDKYSLGLLTMISLMQVQFESGIRLFDFTVGDEAYKKSFGTERVELANIIYTDSPLGQAAHAAYCTRNVVRHVLKCLFPNVL